jgi:phosphatidate cytidylyltransferase
VFRLTLAYFLVGAIATLVVNRTSARGEHRARWTKVAAYFVIVHVIIITILAGRWYFRALAAVIVAGGFGELVRVAMGAGAPSRGAQAVAFGAYAANALAFLRFAGGISTPAILFVYVVVLTFDGFSQVTGQMFGRHPLAPALSPGKTVEGLVGGLATALGTALLLSAWAGIDQWAALALSLLVAVSALAGDLGASRIKRACRVKDFGAWIPGHGGVLDRFDSFIAAGAVYWIVLGR